MIPRRMAIASGRTLNGVSEDYAVLARAGQLAPSRAREVESAVRTANAVIFQYYLIPRKVREQYFREELVADGVPLYPVPEG